MSLTSHFVCFNEMLELYTYDKNEVQYDNTTNVTFCNNCFMKNCQGNYSILIVTRQSTFVAELCKLSAVTQIVAQLDHHLYFNVNGAEV